MFFLLFRKAPDDSLVFKKVVMDFAVDTTYMRPHVLLKNVGFRENVHSTL